MRFEDTNFSDDTAPELLLWYAVLKTWIDGAKSAAKHNRDASWIRTGVESEWTQFICEDLLGVSHACFLERIEEILGPEPKVKMKNLEKRIQ